MDCRDLLTQSCRCQSLSQVPTKILYKAYELQNHHPVPHHLPLLPHSVCHLLKSHSYFIQASVGWFWAAFKKYYSPNLSLSFPLCLIWVVANSLEVFSWVSHLVNCCGCDSILANPIQMLDHLYRSPRLHRHHDLG